MDDRRFTPRLRRRLVVAFALSVAITTLLLSAVSYLLVGVALQRDARDGALAQARFNVLLARSVLPENPDAADYERLLEALRIRGDFQTLIDTGSTAYVSGPQVSRAVISEELTSRLSEERLSYQTLEVGGEPTLIVAGRARADGPALYFFFPLDQPRAVLARLRNVLLGSGLFLTIVGVVAGGALARRTLHPVARARVAATRMAAGDLSVRLPEGPDEFGELAASFNAMARALEGKIGALQAAQARERRFVSDVAHELRTPVAALVGEASLLSSRASRLPDGALPPDLHRAIELVAHDIGRLRHLVDELLEISRIDAGAADIEWEEIEVFDFLARTAAAQGWPAEVTLVGSGEVEDGAQPRLALETDQRRFERIVVNLVENALRHGKPPVVIEVRRVAPAGRPPQMVLSVTDHGPGIGREHLPHVFDRFYKADPSRSSSGSGLGLAIARENARLLGGTLSVRSNPGEGTRFTLRLPLRSSPAPHGLTS